MTAPMEPVGPVAQGLSLYAILPADRCDAVRADGLPDGVRLIAHGPFAAVVEDAAPPVPAGGDRAALAGLLMAQQAVVERLLERAPLLPVKFGTVAPDRAGVVRCLDHGRTAFEDAFKAVAGKTQFEVLVTWDLGGVFAAIADEPAIRQAKAWACEVGGQAGQDAAARLGALVKQSLERRRGQLADHLAKAVRTVAIDTVVGPLMDDRMILNLALLVASDDAEALDGCLRSLDKVYDGALTLRCVGPLPPHSFATVEVTFLEPGRLRWARRTLEVAPGEDAVAVRAAYRRLAKSAHPDVADDPAGAGRLAKLTEAYRMLSSFHDADGPVVVSVRGQQAA